MMDDRCQCAMIRSKIPTYRGKPSSLCSLISTIEMRYISRLDLVQERSYYIGDSYIDDKITAAG